MQARMISYLNQHTTSLFVALALLAGAVLGLAVPLVGNPLYLIGGVFVLLAGFLALQRIEYGLLILVTITYTRLSDVLIQYHGAPSVAKLFVPLLLALVLGRWVLYREEPASWLKTAVALGGYGLVIFASILWASQPNRTINGLEDYVKDALIALVIVMILRRGITLRRVIWCLLASAIFLATITTYQHLTHTFTNNYWGFAQADIRQIVGETSGYRIAGPLASNFYALVLVAIIPLALDRFWHEKGVVLRILAGWALLVCTLSIIFTYSRGGFLALIVVVGLMLLRRQPNPLVLVATLALVAIIWQFLPAEYTNRISTLGSLMPSSDTTSIEAEGSFRGRLSEITVAWLMFAEHPIHGVGYANYNNNYLEYAATLGLDQRREERSAHSLYLEIAAESGILGLFAFGLILNTAFAGLKSARNKFRAHGLDDYAFISEALTVSLIGYLTGSLFLHLGYPRYFWMLIGIAYAAPNVFRFEYLRLAGTQAADSSEP